MSAKRLCPSTGTYSEQYKFRCLARHVANIVGRQARRHWLAMYAKKNGLKAAMKLEALVHVEFPTRREPIEG